MMLESAQPLSSFFRAINVQEDALVVDLMLWLCTWGEAGNLRHMPECLCFLYHKMMQARKRQSVPSIYTEIYSDRGRERVRFFSI